MTHTVPIPTHPAPWSTLTLGDGRTLSYAEYGDPQGQPLVLLHGTPGSRLDFESWAETLAAHGLRGIAVDRPGMGRSSAHPQRTLLGWAQDVRALADHLGLRAFSVLGASGGGPHALACGHALPERVRQVVLVSSGVPIETPHFTRKMALNNRLGFWCSRHWPALLWGLARAQLWMLRHRPGPVLNAFVSALGPEDTAQVKRVGLAPVRHMLLEALAGGPAGLVRETELHARPWGFAPAEMRVPVTIWHGQQDRLVPVSGVTHLAERLPQVRVHLLDRHGHMLDLYVGTLHRILRAVAEDKSAMALDQGLLTSGAVR